MVSVHRSYSEPRICVRVSLSVNKVPIHGLAISFCVCYVYMCVCLCVCYCVCRAVSVCVYGAMYRVVCVYGAVSRVVCVYWIVYHDTTWLHACMVLPH
jgi:hypothetical protein